MAVDQILKDIQSRGYSIQENIFSRDDLVSLQNEILSAYHNNSFKDAGIGKKSDLVKNVRGDQILWLAKENISGPQKIVWDFLETLKTQMNYNLYFGLKDFETHVTVYPKNTFYKKHIDQFKTTDGIPNQSTGQKTRKVSFIIYLNSDWTDADGGELRLFDSCDQEKAIKTISPQFGRAVFFLSDEFPHEVLETKKERISMTGWFYQ